MMWRMAFRYHASRSGAKREWSFKTALHGIFCLSRQLLPDETGLLSS